jgi:transposase, IS30 family
MAARRVSGSRSRLSVEERLEVHRRLQSGESFESAGSAVGCSRKTIQRLLIASGGLVPRSRVRSRLALSVAEREELSRGLLAGVSFRGIAAGLGRAPSTIAREVAANGGRIRYRAWRAERRAERRAKRPKVAKLASCARLRREVERRLDQRWSPEQIAHRLKVEFPDDPEMRVSHETIYQSLYIQARGALRKELTAALRTGRNRRHHPGRRRGGQLTDMVPIADRPAEADDRAVPGHWEGDLLLIRSGRSALATLVERSSRYLMLVNLPRGRTAAAVRRQLAARVVRLPGELTRSITWDQGKEMAEHARFTIDTGIQIYFCDPQSPWQRGTNENTNGLLRQYFPRSAALSGLNQRQLDRVARELNSRPRRALNWMTPAEAYAQAVALTG